MPPAVEAFIEMSRATASDEAGARFTAAKAAATSRPLRFTVFAAGFALAAALGALVGSLSASGLAHLWPQSRWRPPWPTPACGKRRGRASAMKASLDVPARNANGQFAKLADRLERVERSGSEPATNLTRIGDSVDRLERKTPDGIGAGSARRLSARPRRRGPRRNSPTGSWKAGSCRTCAAAGRWSRAARAGCSWSRPAHRFPASAASRRSSGQDGQWVVVTARGMYHVPAVILRANPRISARAADPLHAAQLQCLLRIPLARE